MTQQEKFWRDSAAAARRSASIMFNIARNYPHNHPRHIEARARGREDMDKWIRFEAYADDVKFGKAQDVSFLAA